MSAVSEFSGPGAAAGNAKNTRRAQRDAALREELRRGEEDFDIEPVPGLPEALPEGERILWSGTPKWTAVALDIFHVRAVAFYALILIVWRVLASMHDGASFFGALAGASILALVLGFGIGLLSILALMTAKTTRYTITNRRVVMRIGVALTMSINLPFKQVTNVDYRPAPFGTGAVALSMESSGGLGYAVLWPHVRPFKMSQPQPMLRCIPDGERVARLLGHAIVASRSEPVDLHVRAKAAGQANVGTAATEPA